MVGVRKRKTNRSRQVPWLLGNESTNSGDNSEVSHSSPRWKTRTRQEEGRKTEKVIAKKRNATGGNTTVPDYNATMDSSDNSMLVYPAWRNVHGVTPIVATKEDGYRNSLVFYPLKAFKNLD